MSEITEMLVETASRVFSDHCTKAVLDAAETGTFPQALWDVVEECGFPSMLAAEKDGGISASPREAVAVLRIAGRHGAPLPLAETMIARWLGSRAGLTRIPGPVSILFVSGDGESRLRAEGGALHGCERAVPWGASVRSLLVVKNEGSEARIGRVESSRFRCAARNNIAGEPRDDLTADGIPVEWVPVAGVQRELVFRMASLFRGGLICGALERILQLSVSYAQDRIQFGRPLAKFQAVQQQLAVLAGAVAAASAITDAAARAAERSDGELMIAAMRSRLADAIDTGAAIAHQVHGAMGFTREYVLHASTRRLWGWRDEYGSATEWRERLGRAFAGTPADELWPRLAMLGS